MVGLLAAFSASLTFNSVAQTKPSHLHTFHCATWLGLGQLAKQRTWDLRFAMVSLMGITLKTLSNMNLHH
ncbi:hypothetical protein PC116_g19899 [Phytophthora cactorum]|uniref:Uncharacterized protein n=1 Tax=Phytophthora cactorum TaxID=29920 RepID=A0A8T1KCA6_9STRA|nr:hypothetical protein Pcac1_g17370 [Phytophthora cactorum]KAG2891300.1 hypothetical protein PC114_g17070 [Phytophthora cactorum]KAG2981628.1 hypothetical protein PC118_g10488 [Phytophthora cactorum]KAG4048708.1 hypothetical protein PC123_g15994 [Phytophthora cactorum]KAG4231841.1 hypothetical protein PC116_g19899 [Phytophthora cactorum]